MQTLPHARGRAPENRLGVRGTWKPSGGPASATILWRSQGILGRGVRVLVPKVLNGAVAKELPGRARTSHYPPRQKLHSEPGECGVYGVSWEAVAQLMTSRFNASRKALLH